MSTASIHALAENTATMTFAEGLAFIERTRRQLDRFDAALPHPAGTAIQPQEAEEIRQMCDKLEADIKKSLSSA